ncbi:MAG TPA: type II secretion system F family protein [Capsulimonadaceae bacterium]|nr:type II secretion system F family protein [Capsulimonadaceae bacterium]
MASTAKLTDMAVLYRQLSVLTSAGISPASSAGVIVAAQRATMTVRNPGNPLTRRAFEAIKQRVWQGMKLSQAMAEWPQIFPKFHLVLIAEGEATGQLDNALSRLAQITERDLALNQELRKQTLYPTIVLYLGTPIFILALVTGQASLISWGCVALIIACFVLFRAAGFLIAEMQGQSRPWALQFAMTMPFVGAVTRRVSIAYFIRALGLLYGAGIPMPAALSYAAEASGNPWLAAPIFHIIPRIEAGQPLRETLASTGRFPPDILAALTTGEMTGGIDSQLARMAVFYEDEVARQMKTFCVVLGLIVLLTISSVTGYMFITTWKHYYENMIYHPFGPGTPSE